MKKTVIINNKKITIDVMPYGNRDIKSKNINDIKVSVDKYGILRDVIIIKTRLFSETGKLEYYIADGQHLYYACISLGKINELGFKLCKKEFTSMEDLVVFISTLNNVGTKWSLSTYIKSFCSTNEFPDYNTLQTKHQLYNLSYELLAMLYGGLTKVTGPQILKEGKFKIINEKRGDIIAQQMQEIALIFGKANSTILSIFADKYIHWVNASQCDFSKFLKYIKANKEKLSLLKSNEITDILQKYK